MHRQRIPEFSCVRKETVDIDILVTSRNGERKIKQSIIIKSSPPSRIRKWNQINTYRKDSKSDFHLPKQTNCGAIALSYPVPYLLLMTQEKTQLKALTVALTLTLGGTKMQ